MIKANEETINYGVKLDLIQADIRNICFKKKFFALLNLFTSFGYFETDEENFLFVKHSSYFLKESGFYILDYFNKDYLAKNLVPESKRIIEGTSIVEYRKIEKGRVLKNIKLTDGNRQREFIESVRLYDWKFLIDEFSKYGFKAYKLFGDYYGSDFDENNSPRLIVIFQI